MNYNHLNKLAIIAISVFSFAYTVCNAEILLEFQDPNDTTSVKLTGVNLISIYGNYNSNQVDTTPVLKELTPSKIYSLKLPGVACNGANQIRLTKGEAPINITLELYNGKTNTVKIQSKYKANVKLYSTSQKTMLDEYEKIAQVNIQFTDK